MDHRNAVASKASERYLLGEMSEPERFAFEAHYFDCLECAADVRAGAVLARGIRAVCEEDAATQAPVLRPVPVPERRRLAWLSPRTLVPLAASLVAVGVLGYQSLMTSDWRTSRALAPIVLRAAARGDEQTLELRRGRPYSLVSLDVNSADPGTPLLYEISPNQGKVRDRGSAVAPPPGSPLIIVIPHSGLDQDGLWSLVLRTSQGAEIARYPFSLKLN
jgi:hypothetical protein